LEYLIICIAAFFTSGLTLFSGFGLGTLLLPFFALFFPIELAVAFTAVVHFLNNLFKLTLLGKYADKTTVIRFGLPATVAAFPGAWTLLWFSNLTPLASYQLGDRSFHILPVNLIVAILIVVFAVMEMMPFLERMAPGKRSLPLGGILSGFFGGLSGHQGALRSAFLIQCGLSKEGFLGTGIVIACLVDLSRLSVYTAHFSQAGLDSKMPLLLAATLSAFLGAYIGNRLVKQVTIGMIKALVSILLFIVAIGLGSGII
jgi:uncharacterized membrane protein YfcA